MKHRVTALIRKPVVPWRSVRIAQDLRSACYDREPMKVLVTKLAKQLKLPKSGSTIPPYLVYDNLEPGQPIVSADRIVGACPTEEAAWNIVRLLREETSGYEREGSCGLSDDTMGAV